jgi:hypothetical protein
MLIEENKRYILRNGYICRPLAAYKSTFLSSGVYACQKSSLIFNPTGECLNTFNDETNEFDIVAEAIEHIHWKHSAIEQFGIEYLYDPIEQAKSFANQFIVTTHEIVDDNPEDRPTYNELQASNLKLHQRVHELEEFAKAAIYLSKHFKELTEKHFHKLPKELQEELS